MVNEYLADILIILIAAIFIVPLFQRVGLGPVLGYLVAGAAIGPWGLGFIVQVEEIRHLAEYGVVFLLFIIGIEQKPARLWSMRRLVFGLGSLQVLITGAAITAVTIMFDQPLKVALIIGFGLALSSTAFGIQILAERGELGAEYGRSAFSVLLMQDLAVVPLLALVSLLAADTSLLVGVELAILEAILMIGAVILAGRFFVTPLLQLVATSRTKELFTATAVLAVLGTAWLMEAVGLSLALGAFMAGIMMADSHYRHQIIADIEPFRGILLGLFFIAVGMSINFGLLAEKIVFVAILVVGVLVIKGVILGALCRVMGLKWPDATHVALLLSQSGEFGFVLFGLALVSGLLEESLFQILTLIVALTMLISPMMAKLGARVSRRYKPAEEYQEVTVADQEGVQPHVIIAGFGRVGERVATLLQAADVPYLAIEHSSERVAEARKRGFAVFYGDASQVDVLKASGADRAGALVCTLDQTVQAVRLVSIFRQHYPEITILARAHDRRHRSELLTAGASDAVSETLEAGLQISIATLTAMGVEEATRNDLTEATRREYYKS